MLASALATLVGVGTSDTLRTCSAVMDGFETTALAVGDSAVDQATRTRTELRTSLAGAYRLVVIGSEGFGEGRWLEEWDLTLRPDSTLETAVIGGPPLSLLLSGRASMVWSGRPDRAKAPNPGISLSFRLLAPTTAPLQLESGPFDVVDGNGATYTVAIIDENGIWMGRWIGGGFEAFVLRTPSAEILEHQVGYFCMFPKR